MAHMKRKREPEAEFSFESLTTPDFEELARRFPDFGRAYHSVLEQQRQHGGHFSTFITQAFSVCLTKALLHVHWGLSLTHMPLDRLCPPVPNRYFFVQWLLDQVLPSTHRFFHPSSARKLSGRGLDIGTGASAIYPLLVAGEGRRRGLSPPYHMYATDIDAESVHLAQSNVLSNQLQSHITVLLVPSPSTQDDCGVADDRARQPCPPGPLRCSLECLPERDRALDFCLTNPPFFDDKEILLQAREGDGRSRTKMAVSEGSYPGGEVAFCMDMLVDGLVLWIANQEEGSAPPPPVWTACMCGKKSSWVQLKGVLTRVVGPANVTASEFGPGHLTRWFLAWTFGQPIRNSPLAMFGKSLIFTVDLGHPSEDVVAEVEERVVHYLNEKPSAEWIIAERSQQATGVRLCLCSRTSRLTSSAASGPAKDDEPQLPAVLQRFIQNVEPNLLARLQPPDGDACLVFLLSAKNDSSASIHVEFYAHTSGSRRLLESVRSQLVGEICRSNRRWRRRLAQRERQEELMDVN